VAAPGRMVRSETWIIDGGGLTVGSRAVLVPLTQDVFEDLAGVGVQYQYQHGSVSLVIKPL